MKQTSFSCQASHMGLISSSSTCSTLGSLISTTSLHRQVPGLPLAQKPHLSQEVPLYPRNRLDREQGRLFFFFLTLFSLNHFHLP